MAEGVRSTPSSGGGGGGGGGGGSSSRSLHSGIIQWLVDNFCICEGYSVPRCLMYEIYVETCGQNAQNQVNPATFGKLVRLVFPDLGTRRLGTRGSARYHYDGICIKKGSYFYGQYCYLLNEKKYHSGDVSGLEKPTNYDSLIQRKETVEDLLAFFWRSLQHDTVMFMSLPDVCQLFKCYDAQLYKEIEDILLHDFLEDVSIQYLKSVRLFSKKFKLWLLNALEGFPPLLRISKIKEVTVFVKRLRRKTYLSNMAKTMRMVLNNNRRVNILKSDLHAIVNQGALDIPRKLLQNNFRSMDELESNMELKCLNNLISLLGTSTDVSVFLNCVSSNLQAFVFQPSRSKEEFIRLAASFQLRWNFLLTSVSKAMTLCHTDSFGSWHLFNLLLLEYVIHILQSCIEDEEEEEDGSNLKEMQPNDTSPLQSTQEPLQSPDSSPIKQHRSQDNDDEPPRVTLKHISQSDVCLSSVILKVMGFLVDTATGNKLIQVLLEDKATKSTVKLDLPVGQEALVTLKDGQKFVIHTSDVLQSPEDVYFRETNANI
uniref:DNA-binding protein RFX8 n=1 Tax=Monodelphis domestica TaxID=13616 RepID=A0A5F8G5R7_MONDO